MLSVKVHDSGKTEVEIDGHLVEVMNELGIVAHAVIDTMFNDEGLLNEEIKENKKILMLDHIRDLLTTSCAKYAGCELTSEFAKNILDNSFLKPEGELANKLFALFDETVEEFEKMK